MTSVQKPLSIASGTPTEATRMPPLVDLPGLLALAAFVFSIFAIYLNKDQDSPRVCQALAMLAIVTNLHHFNPVRASLPMLCLGALCGYFSITAFSSQDPTVWDSFTVWAKFIVLTVFLSFLVCKREQLLVVLGALAASAIFVTYASYGGLVDTRELIGQTRMASGELQLARTSGAFANANIMGMYAVDAILAGVTLYLCTRHWLTLVLCISSGAVAAYLALFSGSRKAILGIALVIAFLIWTTIRGRKTARLTTQLVVLALGVTLMAWLLTNPYLARFDTADDSYQERADLAQEALHYAQQYPLWGLGYHGFEKVSKDGAYTHSTPLEILCNGGVMALSIYMILWLSLGRSLYKCLAHETDEKEIVLLYGIGCYCMLQLIGSLASVVIEEPRYLVVTACICGYLRSRELELRTLADFRSPRRQLQKPSQNGGLV